MVTGLTSNNLFLKIIPYVVNQEGYINLSEPLTIHFGSQANLFDLTL